MALAVARTRAPQGISGAAAPASSPLSPHPFVADPGLFRGAAAPKAAAPPGHDFARLGVPGSDAPLPAGPWGAHNVRAAGSGPGMRLSPPVLAEALEAARDGPVEFGESRDPSRTLPRLVAEAARGIGGRAALAGGKLVLPGTAGTGIERSGRSLDELGARLSRALPFRKFRLRTEGTKLHLEGKINPWVNLRTGEVRGGDRRHAPSSDPTEWRWRDDPPEREEAPEAEGPPRLPGAPPRLRSRSRSRSPSRSPTPDPRDIVRSPRRLSPDTLRSASEGRAPRTVRVSQEAAAAEAGIRERIRRESARAYDRGNLGFFPPASPTSIHGGRFLTSVMEEAQRAGRIAPGRVGAGTAIGVARTDRPRLMASFSGFADQERELERAYEQTAPRDAPAFDFVGNRVPIADKRRACKQCAARKWENNRRGGERLQSSLEVYLPLKPGRPGSTNPDPMFQSERLASGDPMVSCDVCQRAFPHPSRTQGRDRHGAPDRSRSDRPPRRSRSRDRSEERRWSRTPPRQRPRNETPPRRRSRTPPRYRSRTPPRRRSRSPRRR